MIRIDGRTVGDLDRHQIVSHHRRRAHHTRRNRHTIHEDPRRRRRRDRDVDLIRTRDTPHPVVERVLVERRKHLHRPHRDVGHHTVERDRMATSTHLRHRKCHDDRQRQPTSGSVPRLQSLPEPRGKRASPDATEPSSRAATVPGPRPGRRMPHAGCRPGIRTTSRFESQPVGRLQPLHDATHLDRTNELQPSARTLPNDAHDGNQGRGPRVVERS